MEYELLNEFVENGYDGNDLDELYEFCIDYILEYEELVESTALSRRLKQVEKTGKGLTNKTLERLRKLDKDALKPMAKEEKGKRLENFLRDKKNKGYNIRKSIRPTPKEAYW